MSWNLTIDVEEVDGVKTATILETVSSLHNLPVGRIILSGHKVGENEDGFEYINFQIPGGSSSSVAYPVKNAKPAAEE